MKNILVIAVFLCSPFMGISQTEDQFKEKRVISEIDSSNVQNMVLKQSFEVNVPLDSVWNAYTTKKGWEQWVAPLVDMDFKLNGVIKTNYNANGKIGDASTITLHIVNYIPKRMLTLQAEITRNFPEFMKADEKDLYNTIFFEEMGPTKTKVVSYGIGYKHNEKYMALMKFFIQGNEQSYQNLIAYLETGKPSLNY